MTALPAPRGTTDERRATGATSGRRSLAAALLLGAAGAAVALIASGQIWARGAAAVGGGAVTVTADGRDVTGVPAALAVVGLAALVAVFAVRRAGRLAVAAVLALSGAGTAVSALLGGTGSDALDEKAAQTTGDSSATVHALSHTGWPYVAAVAGVLILAAGLLAVGYGRRWPAMSGRYERGTGAAGLRAAARRKPVVDPDRPEDVWKALDRGEDPTEQS
ncbi:TIGR02234 family membrane protein [Streptomyces sp. NPDC047002]|uniref:TIGR02234 family membrane protein n=1 Tax=Streptomyces sp. NPDC047002 TaxID=3155475 RepID=UPI0034522B13